MPQIFVNYRREDEPWAASGLGTFLVRQFGQAQVFYDRTGIQPGDDFPRVLSEAASTTVALLVLVGPNWVSACDDRRRRLPDEHDWVCREILLAKEYGARIIPVLTRDKAHPLASSELPRELAFLADLQHMPLKPHEGEECLRRIAAQLEDLVPGLRRRPPTSREGRAALLGVEEREDGVVLTFQRPAGEVAATPQEHFRWLKQRFVPPPGLAAVREKLHEHRVVLLHGDPGIGRRSAAKILLGELAEDGRSFVEFVNVDSASEKVLTNERLQHGVPHLLDLADIPDEAVLQRQGELREVLGVLEAREAHLVVVLSCSTDVRLPEELHPHVVSVDPPGPEAVLRSHSDVDGVGLPGPLPDFPELQQVLQGPVRDIAALAGRVVACRQDNPGWTVEEWLRAGLDEAGEHTREVAAQLQKDELAEARSRGVLLAAALCEGVVRDAVFFAAQELFAVLADLRGERARLEQDGYGRQLEHIGVREDDAQRLTFPRYGYAGAVRRYFWDNYPDLRKVFREWADRLTELDWLTRADCRQIVDRYVEQSLRTGHAQDLQQLVEGWLELAAKHRARRVELATRALMVGVVDDRHGPRFRKLLYKWSKEVGLAAHMGQVLVRVCTSALVGEFPEQAVVRLHHRARREQSSGELSAVEALRVLSAQDGRVLRCLIHRLAEKFEAGNRHRDLLVFRAVIEQVVPVPEGSSRSLVSEPSVCRSLRLLWTEVLTNAESGDDEDRIWVEDVRTAVQDWLRAAAAFEDPSPVLRILVDAAEGNVHVLAQLYVVARDLGRSWEGDARVVEVLSTLVDRVQGIQPADYVVQPVVEEVFR